MIFLEIFYLSKPILIIIQISFNFNFNYEVIISITQNHELKYTYFDIKGEFINFFISLNLSNHHYSKGIYEYKE